MDYKYLKAFLLTAKHSSFSKAAQELRIAQSAVSRQVRLFEESVNKQLIIRSSKQMVLTPQGLELYQAATDFDSTLQALVNEGRNQEVRVGLLHGVLENWFLSAMQERLDLSHLNLVLHIDKPAALIDGLLDRAYDLALTNDHIQNEMISSLKLFDEELVIISKNRIDVKDLSRHRWITYDKADWLHSVFKKQEGAGFIRVNSMTAIVNMVRRGVGVAIVPTHILRNDDALHRTPVPLKRQPSIYLSSLNYATAPKHLKSVIDALRGVRKART